MATGSAAAVTGRPKRSDGTVYDEEFEDYDDYPDERPGIEPVERPTDQRGERPMRIPERTRTGPSRKRSR